MSKFIDSLKREWEIRLTAGAIIRVCRKLDLKVSDFSDPKMGVADIIEAIVELISPQLDKAGIKKDDFLDTLDAESMKAMYVALTQEVKVAFPQAEKYMKHAVEQEKNPEALVNKRLLRTSSFGRGGCLW